MSNQPSYQECKDYEQCKKVALDRLMDAIVLFNRERYTATLYMVGYVIEIGIKAEFFRLANKEISFDQDKLKKIIDHLIVNDKGTNLSLPKDVKKWLCTFSFPPKTLYELLVFWEKIVSLHSSVKGESRFTVIMQNRYPKNTDGSFHDTNKFLKALNGWKKILDGGNFNSNTYNIEDWKVEIRYSSPSVDKTILEDDAKKALETSLSFLEDVLKIGDEIVKIRKEIELTKPSSIRKKSEPINKEQSSINEDKTG